MKSRRLNRGPLKVALAWAIVAGALLGTGCTHRDDAAITSVFLVRHAEKEVGVQDPSLTEEGRARARALAHVLEDAGVQAIYSTQFARTRETAEAVAGAIGIDVQFYPVGSEGVDAFIQGMAREIRDNQAGRTVLVVGHSNTVPALMRALGATDARDLTEKDYDDLFLVEVSDSGSVRLLQLHYGADSP